MNFALAPTTLATGWSPIVFVTTPAHPASKARRMLLSDSVGGAEASRNGFPNSMPVKWTDRLADMADDLIHGRSDGRTVGRSDGRTVGRSDGRNLIIGPPC